MRKLGACWNRAVFFAIIPAVFILAASGVWAGGKAEESSDYGKYAAAAGLVLPPEQVNIESIVASVDYYYPYPEKPAGAQLFAGNRQIPATGQTELVHIGIQGQAVPFEDLEPMDLVLVVDTGGTMAGDDKIGWVKKSLLSLTERIREADRVAIITAGEKPFLLFPLQPARTGGGTDVSSIISGLEAAGDSDSGTAADLDAALRVAYNVAGAEHPGTNPRGRTRRIILLSDGRGLTEESVNRTVERAEGSGIAVTTVGYGVDYNLEMMREMGLETGGTARFITGEEDIQEHFSDELDRMVYPVAQDVRLELSLASGLRVEKSWGFDHEITPGSLRFTIDTLHNRDYETILAEVRIPSANYTGRRLIASLSGTYRDREGRENSLEREELHVTFIEDSPGVVGYSDPVVLRSGSALHYAETLEKIGRAYHGTETKNREFLEGLIDTAHETRNQLENARMRLQDTVFDDFINLLDNYIATLGKDAGLSENEIETVRNSTEIVPGESDEGLTGQIEPLAQEIAAVLGEGKEPKRLHLVGFFFRQSSENDLSMLLEQTTSLTLLSAGGIQIVPHEEAAYSLRGTIVEMGKTVIVFAELSEKETERVLSVSQVILTKSDELIAMLGTAPPPAASAAAGTAEEGKHPNLKVIDLNPVFPSRLPLYEEKPFGLVKIDNPFDQELADIRVTFFASRVMDRPVLADSAEKIGPNADTTAFLLALFSPDILELRDRLRVSADIELRYKLGDEARRKTVYTTLVVENRNALTWNDDRSVASFVTPRDPEILRTARNIVNAVSGVNTGEVDRSFVHAVAVYEAVRDYGITYVVDPETPFERVSQNAGMIDFVQFPKETLQYRSGDCDDLSVLHTALLEAVGIETAFITIPGHIYIAFAVENPPAAVFSMFPDRDSFILHESKLWVPLELTNRGGNFADAWMEGVRNWRKFWKEGTAELIPTRSAWNSFPPVSAPVQDRPLAFPGDEKVREIFESRFTFLVDRELRKHEEAFRTAADRAGDSDKAAGTGRAAADRAGGSGRTDDNAERTPTAGATAGKTELARLENSLGVVYARFGRYGKAEKTFRRAISAAGIPEARFNLGHLKLLTGQYADAISIYQKMLEDSPESIRVLKALVAAYRLAGEETEAEAYGKQLAALDPGAAAAAGNAASSSGGEGDEAAQTGRASRMDAGSLGIEWEETGGTE